MSGRLLQTIASGSVAAGATAVLAHTLNINGTPIVPDFVWRDNANFTIVGTTTTTVTVRNDGLIAASVNVFVEKKHSIPRNTGAAVLTPAPFVPAVGGGGTTTLCGALTADQINAAIATMATAGGGTVQLCPDVYTGFTSSIEMRGGVTLDGRGSTLIKASNAPAFRLIINADPVAGDVGFGLHNLVLDGARPNTSTPTPWTTLTDYDVDDYVFNQAENRIYICVQSGVSGGAIPSGTGSGIVDGTVIWDYATPLWVPNDDLIYFTRSSDVRLFNVTCRNSRNDGFIFEGSVDIGGVNLGRELSVVGCRFAQNNKAALYLTSAEHATIADSQIVDNVFGGALACSWYVTLTGNVARANTQGCGLLIGRDTRFSTIVGNDLDGINSVVEHISSAPERLHGKIYPNITTITVTPNAVGATAYTYWVVARNADGEVLAVSSTASGTIANGDAAPNNDVDWAPVTGAVSYDILKRVAGYPQLIVTQAGVGYTDVGAATAAYAYEEAFTSYGLSDCVIADNVIDQGVIVLRKSFRVGVADNVFHAPGSAPNVSSPHAIDLQGSSNNQIGVNNRVVDAAGTGAGVALESYADLDFGETLFSNDCTIEQNAVNDTRDAPTTVGITVAASCLRNIVRRNWSDVPNAFVEATTIAYENIGPAYTNGFVVFEVAAQVGDVIAVTMTFAAFGEQMARVWLSDTARGAPTGVPPSGGFTTTTGTDIYTYTANVMKDIQTDASNQIVVEIEEAGAKSFYLCVAVSNGRTVTQVITFT